jgi:hypothetical protein
MPEGAPRCARVQASIHMRMFCPDGAEARPIQDQEFERRERLDSIVRRMRPTRAWALSEALSAWCCHPQAMLAVLQIEGWLEWSWVVTFVVESPRTLAKLARAALSGQAARVFTALQQPSRTATPALSAEQQQHVVPAITRASASEAEAQEKASAEGAPPAGGADSEDGDVPAPTTLSIVRRTLEQLSAAEAIASHVSEAWAVPQLTVQLLVTRSMARTGGVAIPPNEEDIAAVHARAEQAQLRRDATQAALQPPGQASAEATEARPPSTHTCAAFCDMCGILYCPRHFQRDATGKFGAVTVPWGRPLPSVQPLEGGEALLQGVQRHAQAAVAPCSLDCYRVHKRGSAPQGAESRALPLHAMWESDDLQAMTVLAVPFQKLRVLHWTRSQRLTSAALVLQSGLLKRSPG